MPNENEPSPAAMRAATALITIGKNSDEPDRENYGCEGFVSLDDIEVNCLFADTTAPKLHMLEPLLKSVRRHVAAVIDKHMGTADLVVALNAAREMLSDAYDALEMEGMETILPRISKVTQIAMLAIAKHEGKSDAR